MEITFNHICDPCEYLLFDNLCTSEELIGCLNEVNFLLPAFKEPKYTGSAKDYDGTIKKKNKGVFLQEVYHPNFSTYSFNTKVINKIFETVKNKSYTPLSCMQYLRNISGYDILLSAYKNGDYYLSHKDSSVLTILFWFGEESINGGNLVFTDFNHEVTFKKNRAIIFPSHYDHKITEVKTNLDDYVRFSATAFLLVDGGFNSANQPTTVGTNDF